MTVATRSRALELFQGTKSVIGQEKARQRMATLLERQWSVSEGRLAKAHGAIVFGRSGSGKTMLARLMCEMCGLPFAEVNATRYTEAGYAGLDLAQMFLPLIESAARLYDEREEKKHELAGTSVLKRDDIEEILELAETGVILLDEFDKWMLRINHVTGQKDTAIQADLLKIVEGSIEYVSDIEDEVGVPFDSTKVLVICAGAFVGLQNILGRRLDKDVDDATVWEQVTQEDFVSFGLLPELAGRLATHIPLRPLRAEHLRELISQPGGLIEEYRTRFEEMGCEWAVSEQGIGEIASVAIKRETGARAADHVCWNVFSEALFQASTSERPLRVRYEPMMVKAVTEPRG